MENTSKKFPGQGKTPQQYKDSMSFFSKATLGTILLILLMILSGCSCMQGTCDHAKFDRRQYNIDNYGGELYYHNNAIYYGYHSGYYYYYGKPHYYPWDYYYDVCPPFHYDLTTHILVNILVNKPTYKPIVVVKPNRPTHRPNRPKNNTTIKVKNNNTKVIIKKNNGSKRTNKTKINRRKK